MLSTRSNVSCIAFTMKMYEIKSDFFEFIFKLLKYTFLYPEKNSSFLYKLIMVVHLSIVLPQAFFESLYAITAPDGYLEGIKCVGGASFRILTVMRFLHFLIYHEEYLKISNCIKRKSFNFDHFYFDSLTNLRTTSFLEFNFKTHYENLKGFWMKQDLFNEEDNRKQNEVNDIFRKTTMTYRVITFGLFANLVVGATISLVSSYFRILSTPPALRYDDSLKRDVPINELPYRLVIPFLDLKDVAQYKIALYYEAYAISYMSYEFLGNSTWI